MSAVVEGENKLICGICNTKFSSVSTKNRHLKTKHNEGVEQRKLQYIKCPICPEEEKEPLTNHDSLIAHLTKIHSVSIKQYNLDFRNKEEFETWRSQDNREVDFACARIVKRPNGEEYVYYNCNRSDSRGFKNNCTKRALKTGGSIKIVGGVCPSRICAKISKNGTYLKHFEYVEIVMAWQDLNFKGISVKFIETHVGHEEELRTRRLLKKEQEMIVKKLNLGVSNERILQDAREINNKQLERINLITRADIRYLTRKFNIDKKRDADDMIATALKVEEWNEDGKNQAFLFKKFGESHPVLREEDFALGYMNNMMEKKLESFKRIICIDGTHGTNRRNYELTTILIKDDENMGFPVAFLVTNRLDQVIHEVFFAALKEKVGDDIDVEYLMSDDDPKYYNAWIKIMNKKPRRLLCTWHIIKNWNIQGRSKLKKQEIKLEMKKEMRKILKETKEENFIVLKEKYFDHLKKEGEVDFLNYLEKYYFQSQERIMMWAHCYRIGAGINTNMAIESLNKVLKHNKMAGNRNIRIEKLLDLLEELVNEKMWKKILNKERPNTNNYQHKITAQAHMKAEQMKDLVEFQEVGKFKVKSSSGETFYRVSFNELCDEDCRSVYCNECNVCIHRYICECPEYGVKTALCKHIHAVVLYERGSESVAGFFDMEEINLEDLWIQEPTTTETRYQVELSHFLEGNQRKEDESISFKKRKEIVLAELKHFMWNLDKESFEYFTEKVTALKNNMEKEKLCRKRKIEKQTYYPNKKK